MLAAVSAPGGGDVAAVVGTTNVADQLEPGQPQQGLAAVGPGQQLLGCLLSRADALQQTGLPGR